jgi:hypothetical protein
MMRIATYLHLYSAPERTLVRTKAWRVVPDPFLVLPVAMDPLLGAVAGRGYSSAPIVVTDGDEVLHQYRRDIRQDAGESTIWSLAAWDAVNGRVWWLGTVMAPAAVE